MASILPHGKGWRAQLKVGKLRDSETFTTKREATEWANRRAAELRAKVDGTEGDHKTLVDAFRRFAAEVSPGRKGELWECVRLAMFERDDVLPLTLPIRQVTSKHLIAWRDSRLAKVSAGSVLREMSLLGSVFSYAKRDWHWLDSSPLAEVRRPGQPAHRDRVITWAETKGMLRALSHKVGKRPTSVKGQIAVVFLIALRTGMRAGEIVGLTWGRVRPSWFELPETKNGTVRHVPATPKTMRLVGQLRGIDDERVVMVDGKSLDATFRRAHKASGLAHFTFHDTRHSAATRIGRTVGQPGRLSFPEFCRVFGWRDTKYALVYVNPSAADLALKLA